jgi:zinc and cadmium transporter
MLRTWMLTVASVAIVSTIPLAGLLLLRVSAGRLRDLLPVLISLAVGALLGGAFFHLLPEALERSPQPRSVFGWVLLGFLGFFVLERLLASRQRSERRGTTRLPPLAALNLAGDALHNLVDGMVIGAAYLADPLVGVTTTIAVILHEIPQEIGDMAVLLYGGLPVRRAVRLNLFSALSAMVGAVVALVLGRVHARLVDALLPLAAGAFTYVAASDLIPELRRSGRGDSLRQIGWILLGLGLMALGARFD